MENFGMWPCGPLVSSFARPFFFAWFLGEVRVAIHYSMVYFYWCRMFDFFLW